MLGAGVEHVDLDIFDDAQAEIFRLMESDSLPRFKHGKLFKTYVEAMTADKSKRTLNVNPSKNSERDVGNGSVRNASPKHDQTGTQNRQVKQHSAGMALGENIMCEVLTPPHVTNPNLSQLKTLRRRRPGLARPRRGPARERGLATIMLYWLATWGTTSYERTAL